jgi:F-type H+-transporting ATPase subunit b
MVSLNFTLIAQVVNFIILLVILAKFAYKPLLKALDDRRAKIIQDMDSAEQTRLDAEALKKEYTAQLSNAKKEASEIIDRANKTAQTMHDRMLQDIQKDKENIMAAAKEQIEQERAQALQDVRGEVIALSTQIAGKLMRQQLDSAENLAAIEKLTDEALTQKKA